jgi:hypothetical protein
LSKIKATGVISSKQKSKSSVYKTCSEEAQRKSWVKEENWN